MSEEIRQPDGDISAGAWTTTPLWSKINEGSGTPNGIYIVSPDNSNTTGECSVQNPSNPGTYTAVQVKAYARKSAAGENQRGLDGDIRINTNLQGQKTFQADLTENFVQYTQTWPGLSFSQSDMNSLQVLFISTGTTGGAPAKRREVHVDYVELVLTYTGISAIVKIMDSTLGLSESDLRRNAAIRLITETIGLTEGIIKRMWSIRFTTEILGISEAIVRRMYSVRALASTVSIQETFVRGAGFVKMMAETISIQETMLRLAGFVKIISETLGLPELSIRRLWAIRVMSEGMTISETSVRRLYGIKQMIENMNIVDSMMRRARNIRIISETLNILDSGLTAFGGVINIIRSIWQAAAPASREFETEAPMPREIEREA